MKRTRAIFAGLFLAGSLVFAPAASATPQHALPGIDCTGAPTPEVPGGGITGFFQSAPNPLPPEADPFAEQSTTTIYAQYGYAGIRFSTYDLGCGPDLAKNPDAVTGTAVANWLLLLPKAAIAATGATLGAALDPNFLGVFDPLISQVVDGLRAGVWDRWVLLVVAAVGFFLIWMARKQRMSESVQAVGWVLFVMMLATTVFRWPLVAGHAADESVTATLGYAAAGLNGQTAGSTSDATTGATAAMHDALLYQTWLAGTFGSATSTTAIHYGPRIFKDTALTWREADTLHHDPDAGRKLIEGKQNDFEAAAEAIKQADPDAYDNLMGKRSDTRVGFAFLSGLSTLCAVPFLLLASLLVIGALLIVRFGVMLFPAFATLGLFPTLRYLVTSIGSTCAAALINCLFFGVGALVFLLGLRTIFSANMPPWLRVVLVLLLTVIFWAGLKPFRRLTQMAKGRESFTGAVSGPASAGRAVGRLAAKVAGAAVAGGVGGAVAGKVAAEEVRDEVPQRAEASPSPVFIHPRAITAGPAPAPPTPVVIVTSTSDLPSPPQPALRAGKHASPPIEPDPKPAGSAPTPARAEASAPTYDWDSAYQDELATEETR